MKKYILALDSGTTSVRSILFDRAGNTVCMAQHELTQIYPKPGFVEHDPMEIYANQYATMTECIAKSGISATEIAGIGLTNQRETTVVWEKGTGQPVCNAIVWQCRRTADICSRLIADGHGAYIQKTTGLRPDAYFSATKIKWILDHTPGARQRAERGELLFGTVDTWILWKLTGGRVFVTDRTNASRTMLYHLKNDDWDDGLLRLLDIPRAMLPKICSSSEVYGEITLMGATLPVCGIAGDQQAALFGQRCFTAGMAKCTYGTGCFLLAHTGEKAVESSCGLLTTVAAGCQNDPIEYALEGSVFIGGAIIQWLRDELRLIAEAKDSEYFAQKVADSGGIYIVPAFSGLGAPHWDMQARGAIFGLTRGSGRNEIIRAALESIAYQTDDVLQAMQKDLGVSMDRLRVDGGAAANRVLMQFQANLSACTILRPKNGEATALGAAYLAGLACGFYKSKAALLENPESCTVFTPDFSEEKRRQLKNGWNRALAACRAFSAENKKL